MIRKLTAALVAFGCLSFSCSVRAEPNLQWLRASTFVMRGEPEKARAILDALPESPEKLLILTCIELEAGAIEKAAKLVDRLQVLHPGSEDVAVLRALVNERRKAPTGDWVAAFVHARKSVPDTGDVAPVLEFPVSAVDPLAVGIDTARLKGADGFLVRLGEHWTSGARTLYAEALRWANADAPLAVHLLVVEALDSQDVITGHVAEAHAARHALLMRLAKANPGNVYVQEFAILDGPSDAPLSEADVSALERAIQGQERRSPFGPVFAAFEHAYAQVDPRSAVERAWGATFILRAWPNCELSDRVRATEPTASPAMKLRLAKVLEASGRLLMHQGTLLEFGLGTGLLAQAGRLGGDAKLSKEAAESRHEWARLLGAERMIEILSFLPLPTLTKELTMQSLTNERGLAAALCKQAAR